MRTAYEVVGMVCTALLALAFAAACFAAAWHVVCASLERRRDRIRWEKARDVGHDLHSASYWYGEARDVQDVVRAIGDSLALYGHFDSGKIRDEWRAKRGSDANQ